MINLRVENLSFYRSDRYIFKNVNINLSDGDFLYIHGKNGSGKTTLLNILSTKQLSYYGNIWLNGYSINNKVISFEKLISDNILYVSHLDLMYNNLNVEENLNIWKNISLNDIEINLILNYYNLISHKNIKYSNLSKGQRKKITLSLLLILNKPIWLLDEPMVSLDTSAIDSLSYLINKHLKFGGIVIYTSHHKIDFNFKKKYYNLYL